MLDGLKKIPVKWRIWPAVLWAIFIAVFSLMPSQKLPRLPIFKWDVPVHMGIYALLTFLLAFALLSDETKQTRKMTALLLATNLYGLIIEIGQGLFVASRHFEVKDLAMNFIGTLLGMLFYRLIVNKR